VALTWYYVKKIVVYWLIVNTLLASFFLLIDFLSKLDRYGSHLFVLIRYVLSGFSSTFFSTVSLALCLAMLIFMRELLIKNELDALALSGVSRLFLVKVAAYAGLFAMVMCWLLQEVILPSHIQAMHKQREELVLKSHDDYKVNQWFVMDEEQFCYIDSFDYAQTKGASYIALKVKQSQVQEVIQAPSFVLSQHAEQDFKLIALDAQQWLAATGKATVLNVEVTIPRILLESKVVDQSLLLAIKKFVFDKKVSSALYRKELRVLVNAITYYLTLIVYPVLSIVVLLLYFAGAIPFVWTFIGPYLAITGVSLLLESGIACGMHPILLLGYYIVLILVILFQLVRLRIGFCR
jgi:lipopolysaccharide export LptBFGC system permease protein LptF